MIWVDILAGWGQDLYPLGLIGPIIMGGARLLRWCCKQSHNCRSIEYSRTVRIVLKRNLTGIELWTLLHSLQLLVNFKFRAIIENFGHLLAHFLGNCCQLWASIGKDDIFWNFTKDELSEISPIFPEQSIKSRSFIFCTIYSTKKPHPPNSHWIFLMLCVYMFICCIDLHDYFNGSLVLNGRKSQYTNQ